MAPARAAGNPRRISFLQPRVLIKRVIVPRVPAAAWDHSHGTEKRKVAPRLSPARLWGEELLAGWLEPGTFPKSFYIYLAHPSGKEPTESLCKWETNLGKGGDKLSVYQIKARQICDCLVSHDATV